jgi:dTDP-4-dehydrorhamnose 3,5-epimerase-like enzyme
MKLSNKNQIAVLGNVSTSTMGSIRGSHFERNQRFFLIYI